MGNYLNTFVDRRTDPGSILPVTPYERWQLERYGNFIPELTPEFFKQKPNTMEKLKPGRKKIPADQRAKLVSAYLKDADKAAIVKKYGSLTKAVKTLIIPSL
jgi:hypothetical protein